MLAFNRRPEFAQEQAMTTTQLITANDLEAMGSDARFELIQGVLHEMSPSSSDSSGVGARLTIEFGAFVYRHGLGRVTGADGGFFLEKSPDTVIEPDMGFIRNERLGLWPGRRGFFPGIPDFAVEVISPTDEPADIRRKMELYERFGVPLVWWIDPIRRTARVQSHGNPIRHLTESDSLDGESIVPGFSVLLADLLDFAPIR